MSIPMTEYVKITSGVGGGNNIATRQFVGCIFSTNTMLDPLVPLAFTDAADVGTYFGTSSEEYERAVKYFGYMSPAIRMPQSIMFARWCDVDSPATIFGSTSQTLNLTTLKTVTAGLITFDFGGTTVALTGIDLSGAADLAGVATALQTAFRLNADSHLATCTVTYDAVGNRFDFEATSTGVATETFSLVQVGSGLTDVALQLGWYDYSGAAVISAQTEQQPVDAFTETVNITNNFGSFCFTTASALTLAQQTAVAEYNSTLNVMCQYQIRVDPSEYAAASAALISISGVGLTYELATLAEYPEMIPMAIQAATDYTQRNGVVNYMYRQMPTITPSVTDDTLKHTLDAARVNYYGVTQTAGQYTAFYQEGTLCGLATSPQFMGIYANEQWLKDYIGAAILSLQLSLPELSAGEIGRGQLVIVIQAAVNKALFNGTIATGKSLTTTQQIYISNMTGDDMAWHQVQNTGYWLDVNITPSVDPISKLTVYTAYYTLIYSKNDAVQSVQGTHVLI